MARNVTNRAWGSLIACLAVALVGLPHARIGAAAPLSASTETLVATAEKAFAAGNFGRASELFEQAWKASPEASALLYNAARAAQLGNDLDRAEALFEKYLALSAHEPKVLEKATGYLADVKSAKKAQRVDKAKAKARDGEQFQREGRYRDAAASYRDAYRLDDGNGEYLFRAGMAAALGCDVSAARQYLREYLQKAPPDAAERTDAQLRLDAVAKDCGVKDDAGANPGAPGPGPAKQSAAPAESGQAERSGGPALAVGKDSPSSSAAPGGGGTAGAWTALGGAAVAAVGAGLYILARSDGANLVQELGPAPTLAGWTAAESRRASIERQMTTGAVVVGVGAVAAAAGAVMWLSSGRATKAALVPSADGFTVAVAVAF